MGLVDKLKDQFLDVIEFEDVSNKLVVYKFKRNEPNNEIKQGSKVIVREGQKAAFVKGGKLADIMNPGTYTLNTENFPILSSLQAFPFMFTSPVISDVYFISKSQFIYNNWATKNTIIMRVSEFKMARIRAFGKFAFRISDVEIFMKEVFGSQGLVLTFDIINYLSAMVTETFANIVSECNIPVLEFASNYKKFSNNIQERINEDSTKLGIEFSNIIIENVSLPEEVEKLIDEQSGIGMAGQDMQSFMQYQTARAMRDAAKQKGGLAGLGAGMALGKTMIKNIDDVNSKQEIKNPNSKADQLRELKSLLDEGILTQEEFDEEKKKILTQ